VTVAPHPRGASRLTLLAPALFGASSFAIADVLSAVAFREGGDVLTVSTLRGVVGVGVLVLWLALTQQPARAPPGAKWIALGLGVLFAANVFLVFSAIDSIGVALAILTYFVYPLLTGIAAAVVGLERLSWRGMLAAVAAFLGLGLILGATPASLAPAGVMAAIAAACCRVLMLLITRARMQAVNPLTITLYSLISSTALLSAASLVTRDWQPPFTITGWAAVIGLSISVTIGILGVFASAVRIGPFHTALFMNLEPLLAAIISAVLLGEVIAPLQAIGGAVMIVALTAFQLRR
jgi:probable blue pigment (indigoidine) exporter